jgi:hypothetical protein
VSLRILRIPSGFLFLIAGLIAVSSSLPLRAQQFEQRPAEQPLAQTGTLQDQNGDDSSSNFNPETGGSNDRLFWTLPNFLSLENATNVPPLSSGQKFKLVSRSTFDPVQFPFYAFLAGISQADNSESGFGQGAVGYAKRFASNFADGTSENFFVQAIFPSLFRQDPRYYQEGRGGFWRRAGYAVTRTVVTRNDAGRATFNVSELAGAGAAATLSNLYHPATDRNVPNTMQTWASMMGWDTVSNVVKEFWPDIRRKLHRGERNSAGGA